MPYLNLIAILILLPCVIAGLSMAPWMPTRKKDLARINHLAALKKGEIFYELGSGDGRVSYFIAKNNPHCQVIGIEIAWPLFIYSKLKLFFAPQKNLCFKMGNIFKEDLSKADVIYVFAMKNTLNKKLKQKFNKELKKEARIISYVFSINNFSKNAHLSKNTKKDLGIYVYEI